jgi:hypothetical protein
MHRRGHAVRGANTGEHGSKSRARKLRELLEMQKQQQRCTAR